MGQGKMRRWLFEIGFWTLVVAFSFGVVLDLCFPRRTSAGFILGAISAIIILFQARKRAGKGAEKRNERN